MSRLRYLPSNMMRDMRMCSAVASSPDAHASERSSFTTEVEHETGGERSSHRPYGMLSEVANVVTLTV